MLFKTMSYDRQYYVGRALQKMGCNKYQPKVRTGNNLTLTMKGFGQSVDPCRYGYSILTRRSPTSESSTCKIPLSSRDEIPGFVCIGTC